MEESISSKKKEKRKHVDHVESSIFVAPGTVRSSDDLEEDTGDHKVLSRYFINIFLPQSPCLGSYSLISSHFRFLIGWGCGGRAGQQGKQIQTKCSFSTHGLPQGPPHKTRRTCTSPSLLTASSSGWKWAASREMAEP